MEWNPGLLISCSLPYCATLHPGYDYYDYYAPSLVRNSSYTSSLVATDKIVSSRFASLTWYVIPKAVASFVPEQGECNASYQHFRLPCLIILLNETHQHTVCGIAELNVPLLVELGEGRNWDEAH